ncbi:MAG: hypothetical protein DMG41_38275 [Acidobacteria bacterium]|nr:MAG: hypothetical protein DMG41_38275 [Acidobacteriota bacterium]
MGNADNCACLGNRKGPWRCDRCNRIGKDQNGSCSYQSAAGFHY